MSVVFQNPAACIVDRSSVILPCDAYSNGKVVDEKKAIVDDVSFSVVE